MAHSQIIKYAECKCMKTEEFEHRLVSVPGYDT